MLTIEEIRRALADRKLTAVADATGLHYQTVWRVANGNGASYDTIKALSDYLQGREAA